MESPSSSESDYTTVWSAPPKKPSGRTKFKETRHPVFRGVRRRGNLDRWVCEVRNPNTKSRIWLGTFPTAEMAARAHDVAAMAFKGRSACLNFADSAWLISVPSSLSGVQDLKKEAVRIARTLHPGDLKCSVENVSYLSSSTSSTEVIEEKEVVSSQTPESTTLLEYVTDDSVADETAKIDWHINYDEMNLAMYYASLAEGLMMEPPAIEKINCFDDDYEWGYGVSLWS